MTDDLTALREAISLSSTGTIPYDQFRREMTDDQPAHDESTNEWMLRRRMNAFDVTMDGMERRITDAYRQIHALEDRLNSLWQKLGEIRQH